MFDCPMTEEQANQVYDILVDYCDASEKDRPAFVYHHTSQKFYDWGSTEYRFMGSLGFGGKFRTQGTDMYVDMYIEDQTPETVEMVRKTNKALASLGPLCYRK